MSSNRCVALSGRLKSEFFTISKAIIEVQVAVGMITEEIFSFFYRNLPKETKIDIIVGVHMPTPPEVLEKLFELEQSGKITVAIYTGNFFHPKVYLFKMQDEVRAFVGSGNFTTGGWNANEELFVKIDDQQTFTEIRERVFQWKADSVPLTKDFILAYSETFRKNLNHEKQKMINTMELINNLAPSSGLLDSINFDNQFFKKSDFMTFHPTKIALDNHEIWEERAAVRRKLYRLNDDVARMVPSSWQIYPHYGKEYIASQIETENHDQHLVRSLWVGYGRDKQALKMYGDVGTTPLHFMRMQFIIHHDSVGFWLMPAKAHTGKVDRQHFKEQMKNREYREKFFQLFSALGDEYWIDIGGVNRRPSEFGNAEDLHAFTKTDAFAHYLIIGRDYLAGDPMLAVDRIATTCLEEFTKFYPFYEMMLHRF